MSLSQMSRQFTALTILGTTLLFGLSACSDTSEDRQPEESLDSQIAELAVHHGFEDVGSPAEFAESWPYGFDNEGDHLSATVMALGDVQIGADGLVAIQPTPYETVSGERFDGDWSYRLQAGDLQRGDQALGLDAPSSATHEPSAATLHYDGLDVRFEHHHEGLKTFVDVEERLDGDGELQFSFNHDLQGFDFRGDGEELVAYDDEGEEVFRWMGLIAFDEDGQDLPVEMNADDRAFTFTVDDSEAAYPITIDPLATTPSWTAEGSQGSSRFGNRIAVGDANGNGYNDVLLSESLFSGNELNQGRVLFFEGQENAFSNSSLFTVAGDTNSEQFGTFIDMGTDFSGDGCNEAILGGPAFNNGQGRLLIFDFFDCSTTPSTQEIEITWTKSGSEFQFFGRDASLGDFTCNGQFDLLVSSPALSGEGVNGESYNLNGKIEIYAGTGDFDNPFETDPSFSYIGEGDNTRFGWNVETLPVFDGREYNTDSDCQSFATSSRFADGGTGYLSIFVHDEDGEIQDPITFEGLNSDQNFGEFIYQIPSPEEEEVDDQTLSALAVSSSYLGSDTTPGMVEIFQFNEEEDEFMSIWSVESPIAGSDFGTRMTGGVDLNDSGLDDLIIGAPAFDTGLDNGDEGAVLIYLNTEDGFLQDPSIILESDQTGSEFGWEVTGAPNFIGDQDGLLVNARFYDGLVTDGGKVFGYPGQPTCFIDGDFYSDGQENPDNLCQICDTSNSTDSWTDNTDGLTCDDGDGCTISVCEDGQCVSDGTIDCDDGNPCTENDCVDGECTAETGPVDGDTCDDGDGCTISVCQDGQCVADGTIDCDDGNPCTENNCVDGECTAETGPQDGETCDSDDLSCTSFTCDDGDCIESLDEGCLINNTCYEDGAENPSSTCFECNPSESTTSWTPKAEGTTCDDGLFCTVESECDGAGNCAGTVDRECDDVECFEDVTCSNSSSACIPQNPETGTSCDIGDGLDCTSGVCDAGSCTADIESGCLIEGQCIESGTVNSSNECQVCDPAQSETAWSDRSDGTSCDPGDGLSCTSGACTAGSCDTQLDAGCLIEGQCVESGTVNSSNECQVCDPAQSETAWSNRSDGTTCEPGDGLSCTSGSCAAGSCEVQLDTGCLIDNQCIEDGAINPDNDCQLCDPAQNTTDWSNQSDGASCDSGDSLDCTAGSCSAGTCEVEITEGCLIDNQCIEEGTTNPDNECQVCDSSQDNEAYSPASEGTPCGEAFCSDDNELTAQSTCDGASACVPDEITDCGDFLCDEDAAECLTTCDSDDDCIDEAWCDEETSECSSDARQPIADAGEPQVVGPEAQVTLDGTGSFDPDGNPLTYEWELIDGPVDIELDDNTSSTPTFEAPRPEPVDEVWVFDFQLVVNDGELDSEPDATSVTVDVEAEDNEPPVAVIEGPDTADAGDTITLDGSESFDPDGDPIVSYQWSVVDGLPEPTIVPLEEEDDQLLEVTFDEELEEDTLYDFGLIVSDGLANSSMETHEVLVLVEEDPEEPVDPEDPEDPQLEGNIEGSGCVCSSTNGQNNTEGMIAFFLLLGFAAWRRVRSHG